MPVYMDKEAKTTVYGIRETNFKKSKKICENLLTFFFGSAIIPEHSRETQKNWMKAQKTFKKV